MDCWEASGRSEHSICVIRLSVHTRAFSNILPLKGVEVLFPQLVMATGRDHSESKKSDEILGSHGADMMSLQLGREDSPSSFSADDFDGSGRTRRLLERVGHLQSALSCLLAPEDVSSLNDGEKAVVENGLATNHEGGSLSDLFVQQPMVRTCQNLGASLKDSLALHHATISSIDGAAADLKMMKSTSAVLSRKRKPT